MEANLVLNGSFEELYDCAGSNSINNALGWACPCQDSTWVCAPLQSQICFSNAPNTGFGYQEPFHGNRYCRMTAYCTIPCSTLYSRSVIRNRLKQKLVAGQEYCVKLELSLEDVSPTAIAEFGFCFTDSSVDTIVIPTYPLSFLTPQVVNPSTNILSDTMNWVTISGTFTASGIEKYMLLGVFLPDAQVTTSMMVPNAQSDWAEYFVDAISCIPTNVSAYAGPDKPFIQGDSVYIGRKADFAVDPYCFWYKLPNMTTAIDTASGLWVKPTATTTYVVRQELECNTVKWDTVIVFEDALGFEKQQLLNGKLHFLPQPSISFVDVSLENENLGSYYSEICLSDSKGIILFTNSIDDKEDLYRVSTTSIPNGMYILTLRSRKEGYFVTKKLVVQH